MRRKNCKTVNVFFVIVLIFFVSCKKDKPEAVAITNSTGNVYIVCEGSLGNGNAALSLYDSKAVAVNEDIYKSSNAGQPLGDIFQSMQLIGNRFFLCVNNSDKVVAIDKATHKFIGSINILKPRYILSISPIKAYVSTLFSNKIYIINPQTLEVTGSMICLIKIRRVCCCRTQKHI